MTLGVNDLGKALLGLIMVSLTLLIGLFVYATFIL